jgi:hypothetical protein
MIGRSGTEKREHMRTNISSATKPHRVTAVVPPWPLLSFIVAIVIAGSLPLSAQSQRPLVARTVALELVCGPQAALTTPPQTIRIVGGAERRKALFSAGDAVMINAGTAQGLRAGQHFYVRRIVSDSFVLPVGDTRPVSIHTAGWLTIVETQAEVSVATVVENCDGISEGDYLEPLVLPPSPQAGTPGEADYARPARVILGGERRQLGTLGSLMVIDRGSDHGLRPGQRLTLFRETLDGHGPVLKIGDAVVASTQHETSLVRIGATREEVQVGDLVAIHR